MQGTKLCHAAISVDSESRQRQKVIPTNDALSQSGVKHIVITRSAAPFPPSRHCLSSQRAPRDQPESSVRAAREQPPLSAPEQTLCQGRGNR